MKTVKNYDELVAGYTYFVTIPGTITPINCRYVRKVGTRYIFATSDYTPPVDALPESVASYGNIWVDCTIPGNHAYAVH